MYSNYKYYKEKYLQLKQYGGFNLNDWKEIPNSGQRNCGIFINDKEPDKLMKCDTVRSTNTKVNDFNNFFSIFPKIYNEYTIDQKYYTIMQKFDGDITHFLFNVIPKQILKSGFESFADQIFAIFDYMLPRTKPLNISLETFKDFNVSIELYKKFLVALENELIKIIPIINKQIAMLEIILLSKGYSYQDFKYDNFGYTYEDSNHPHLGINWKDNKIYDKYIFVYILDWESGLVPIAYENNDKFSDKYIENKKHIIHEILSIINHKTNFSVNGQYNLKTIGRINKYNLDINYLNSLKITDILNSEFKFNLNLQSYEIKNLQELYYHLFITEQIIFQGNSIYVFFSVFLDDIGVIDTIKDNHYSIKRYGSANMNELIVTNENYELLFINNGTKIDSLKHSNIWLILYIIICNPTVTNTTNDFVSYIFWLLANKNIHHINRVANNTFYIKKYNSPFGKYFVINQDNTYTLHFMDETNKEITMITHNNLALLFQLLFFNLTVGSRELLMWN